MNLDVRYASHPEDSKHYTTDENRSRYLINKIFDGNKILLTYSHIDRIIAGGAMPINEELKLETGEEIGSNYFLERREMGIINVGGKGIVTLDKKENTLSMRDGLYAGIGIKEVIFSSLDPKNPAKFYINSCPAHQSYPVVKIGIEKAKSIALGEQKNSNVRTIFQYIHPDVCNSCQLVMGITVLEPNNVWNTMPCHTHERRMEVYFYFNMSEDTRVFHFMGQPGETRHIIVQNEQAVISPSWSIHSGVGTSSYAFIWGMCGENQVFTDVANISIDMLK
jgi:4-deoxy-L-threo-5-hexosulose-uronate ketol-isomerase